MSFFSEKRRLRQAGGHTSKVLSNINNTRTRQEQEKENKNKNKNKNKNIFFSNKKTSSITIYSSPTRRHLFFSNKKTSILVQQEDIYSSPTRRHMFFSNNKTYSSPTRRHLLCPYSIYHVSRARTCLQSTHIESIRTRHGQNQKNEDFDFFSGLKDDLWDIKYYHH